MLTGLDTEEGGMEGQHTSPVVEGTMTELTKPVPLVLEREPAGVGPF